MANSARCACACCTIRGLLGPAVVITVGVLLLLHELHGGYFDFGNTWPVILVVIGVILLVSALAPKEGHISSATPTPPSPPAPPASGSTPGSYQQQGQ